MEIEKYNSFLSFMEAAVKEVSQQILDLEFVKEEQVTLEGDLVCVVMGIVGKYRGRVIFQVSKETSEVIAEIMNGEPVVYDAELYLCISEFVNIFCGNAVTYLNNKYRGTELRLTPPAVFEGEGINISTPNIKSLIMSFSSIYGPILVDVGMEGVV